MWLALHLWATSGAMLLATEATAVTQQVIVDESNGQTSLHLGSDPVFYSTARAIQNVHLIPVENSPTIVVVWEESDNVRGIIPMYAVFLDGRSPARISETSYGIQLRYAQFDPVIGEPSIADSLRSNIDGQIFIVQFHGQLLPEFNTILAAEGAQILRFIPNNAAIARVQPPSFQRIESIPFVRSVVRFHPAYRIDAQLLAELLLDPNTMPVRRYSAELVERGDASMSAATGAVVVAGGEIIQTVPQVGRIVFRASGLQALQIIQTADLLFVDISGESGLDMDRVRYFGGANHVELVGSFRGQGVRAEVMDLGLWTTHIAFQNPPIVRTFNNSTYPHGTRVYGILFSNGAGDLCPPEGPCGRGLLPEGQGIFSAQTGFDTDPPTANRYIQTSQLVRSVDCSGDPLCPYEAVFQTNSWGQSHRLQYTTFSAEFDQIAFDLDITLCQSQGNCGRGVASLCQSSGADSNCTSRRDCSRPEAWSKNVLSIGAIFDLPNEDHRNDKWCPADTSENEISCGYQRCGSRGPAIDGRVKPDLVNFIDCIRTTAGTSSYDPNFGGTSAATPITCGYAGLVFQMWHEGVFKVWNGTTSVTTGGGASVFADRPHASTVKAMLINTAYRYPLVTEPPNYRPDFTRDNMGWGIVDVAALYEQRETMFIVNETDLLKNLFTKSYTYSVLVGSPVLRVTMVYADPPATPCSTIHLVNDLTLKVVSPSGTTYWGNNGLVNCLTCLADYFVGNWSVPGGTLSWDHVNNVENVFIKNPAAGNWTITVMADSIVQDGHVETTLLDADYALVVSSAERPRGRCCTTNCTPTYHCDCTWTSKADCTGTGKVWSSEDTCADDCGTTCPDLCIE